MSAARALARAEAAGVRLRLGADGRVEVQTTPPPPADVLEELRRHRADVAHLLALRAACADPSADAPPPPPPPQAPPDWSASIAQAVRAALADGAVRIADDDGWLLLVRPDGRRLVVAPAVAAQLAEAGLLPPLPGAVGETAAADDPDADAAERAAIQGEPPLPPEGTPERERMDQRHAETVRGLLESALVRPSFFAGEARRPPPAGSSCSACRGRQWWFPARPKDDGTGPSAHWRCAGCRPPGRLTAADLVEVRT